VKIGTLQDTPAGVGLSTRLNQGFKFLHPGATSPVSKPCEFAAEYVIDLPQGSLANNGLLFNVRIKDIDAMPALTTRLRAADKTSLFIFSSASCLNISAFRWLRSTIDF
jgi:hypothetical protein